MASVAEVKPKAGVGFRASVPPFSKPIAMLISGRELHPLKSSAFHGALLRQRPTLGSQDDAQHCGPAKSLWSMIAISFFSQERRSEDHDSPNYRSSGHYGRTVFSVPRVFSRPAGRKL
jgi:hypothetical protein